MGKWVEANIYYENPEPNQILLNCIKPLIYRLEEENKLKSFHVLGEPGPRLLLRILTTEEHEEEITASIKTWENMPKIRIEFRDYKGERETFGDAWASAFKVMEAGTRCRLDFIDETVSKADHFNVIGLNHYFLNSMGYSIFEEANLHAQMTLERLIILDQLQHKAILERVIDLEKRQDKVSAPNNNSP